MSRQEGVAFVVGASIGGLCAARVLADHFEEVIVVEKDGLDDAFAPRKGVPQGRHTHALLARGAQLLEQFFPGLTQDALAAGAIPVELTRDVLWFNYGVFLKEAPSGEIGISLSRPRFEGLVRRRLAALGNVRILDRTEAVEPIADEKRARVVGLRTRTRGELSVDRPSALVIDAGGRGARTPAWLEAMGFARAPEDSVKVDIGYTTCMFRRRPEQLGGHTAIVMGLCAPDWRGGAMVAQEDSTWIVTLGGYLGDKAPSDARGFLDYARSLQKPDVYEALKDAEPLCEPFLYNIPSNLRRRYEKLERFPEGYLPFGDALCSFNPIYGQGMTVAATEADALAKCLAQGQDRLAPRFFKAAAKVIDIPWDMAVGSDLQNPGVEGARPLRTRFINWWVRHVFLAAAVDATLSRTFVGVANLSLPPTRLLGPDAVLRVVRHALGARSTAAPGFSAEPKARRAA